jgi:hypothetical protein
MDLLPSNYEIILRNLRPWVEPSDCVPYGMTRHYKQEATGSLKVLKGTQYY